MAQLLPFQALSQSPPSFWDEKGARAWRDAVQLLHHLAEARQDAERYRIVAAAEAPDDNHDRSVVAGRVVEAVQWKRYGYGSGLDGADVAADFETIGGEVTKLIVQVVTAAARKTGQFQDVHDAYVVSAQQGLFTRIDLRIWTLPLNWHDVLSQRLESLVLVSAGRRSLDLKATRLEAFMAIYARQLSQMNTPPQVMIELMEQVSHAWNRSVERIKV